MKRVGRRAAACELCPAGCFGSDMRLLQTDFMKEMLIAVGQHFSVQHACAVTRCMSAAVCAISMRTLAAELCWLF